MAGLAEPVRRGGRGAAAAGARCFGIAAAVAAALVAAAMCARTALRSDAAARRGWALMAASALFWAAGEAACCWYELIQGHEAPFPSAVAGFLLAVPLAVAAVLIFAEGAAAVALHAARHPHAMRPSARQTGARIEDGVRLWLARELHDDALQILTTTLIEMEEVRRGLPDAALSQRVTEFQASIRSVISGLRRILGDLRDQSGEDHRLVEDLTTLLGQLDHRAGIKGDISVSPGWPTSLSTHIASNLRRIAEQALHNVALHSGAERVMVSLDVDAENLILTVSDDGQGCAEACPKGTGMLGMEERALILGGRLEVRSDPGAGTMVRGTFAPTRTA
jgi:signal transduction histidine kinase